MIRSVRAHPGVFIGGMVTYAVLAHWLLPRFAPSVAQKLPAK